MSGKAPRSFCGTKNNPTEDDFLHFSSDNLMSYFSYFVMGAEEAKTGTPHIQFYGECKEQIRFNKLVKLLNNSHIEARKGTPKQAAGYCKKGLCDTHIHPPVEEPHNIANSILMGFRCECCREFTGDYEFFFPRTMEDPETWQRPFEHGTISQQGKRTELSGPTSMIAEEGLTLKAVAKVYPEQMVKYHKGFAYLRSLLLEPRSLPSDPEVIVLWGPTGTGKTRDALKKFFPDEPHYVFRPSNGNWWDHYDGEKKVILDEFRGQMPWSDLLGLLDRNEFRAPYKGGFINIQASMFIITSPCPPTSWYQMDDRFDKFSQLQRRMTKIIHYKEKVAG